MWDFIVEAGTCRMVFVFGDPGVRDDVAEFWIIDVLSG